MVSETHALPQWLALGATEHQLKQTCKAGKFVGLDDSPPPTNFLDAKTIAVYTKSSWYSRTSITMFRFLQNFTSLLAMTVLVERDTAWR